MLTDELHSDFLKLQHELQGGPIYPEVTAAEIRSHLARYYDFSRPAQLDDVVADVWEMMRNWNVQITHPRYLGLFNPSVTFASVVADVVVAMHNPQLASWRTAPAANEIERHTLAWLTAKFGLPESTIATFTTGGAEANLSAVIVALTRAFPDYAENGLRSLDRAPVIYLTSEAHHSFSKIAHMAGLGREAIRLVPTDEQLKMNVQALERQIDVDRRRGLHPLMAVGTCGSTTAGTIDPLGEIGLACSASDMWFHVDAAWGGASVLSPRLRTHLAGIESADSITCDAHKWFSVPMGCGMFFCRHRESVSQAFRVQTGYMPQQADDDMFDPYTHSVQWSRRFAGLKLFMSLAQHGEVGYTAMIERQAHMGDLLRRSLLASGWTLMNDTPLPVVCFTRAGLCIPELLASMRQQQIAWISEAVLQGRPVLRACITSYKTTEQNVLFFVDEINRLVGSAAPMPTTV